MNKETKFETANQFLGAMCKDIIAGKEFYVYNFAYDGETTFMYDGKDSYFCDFSVNLDQIATELSFSQIKCPDATIVMEYCVFENNGEYEPAKRIYVFSEVK